MPRVGVFESLDFESLDSQEAAKPDKTIPSPLLLGKDTGNFLIIKKKKSNRTAPQQTKIQEHLNIL